MRQSLVDVGLSIARPSDLFLMIVYTVNYIDTILLMLMTWRRNERGHHLLFNLEHPDLNTRNINFAEEMAC